MEKHLFARFRRPKPNSFHGSRPEIPDAAPGKPFLVPCLVLRASATDAKPYHDHRNQQPEEGKGNRDQAKSVHEPRLIEIAEVLIDEPEHPAEEHERYQFSQCVDHGS